MNINIQFSLNYLHLVIADVRKAFPGIKVSKSWTWKLDDDHYEFHGPDKFYWHGSADNAYDARAKGWSAYLDMKGEKR